MARSVAPPDGDRVELTLPVEVTHEAVTEYCPGERRAGMGSEN